MECNKEEARRAINIAEKKLSVNDYNAAKRFVNKARTLYPNLDGLEQMSVMIDVYISASNKNNNVGKELDWYGILAVDPLANEEALKRQYKKLALLLHPDKNRFRGAEGAFKLVLNAWSLLSDKALRTAYDQKRKSKEAKEKKSEPKPPQHYPTSCNVNRNSKEAKQKKSEPKPQATSTNASTSSAYYSDEASAQARERFRKGGFDTNFTQQQREKMKRIFEEAKCGHAPTTSASDSAKAADEQMRERVKRLFEESNARFAAAGVAPAAARENADEAERPPLKKPVTVGNPYSRFEDPNSTHEAQRLFKKPMTTGNLNSTFEAQRIFSRSRWADVK